MKKKLLLLALSTGFSVLCLAGFDRTLMRLVVSSTRIPTSTRMVYKTTEFEFIADINSDGFRDVEFSEDAPDDGDTIQIAVVGDSFTYGWGVYENDAWPRVLEKILQARGHHVRVINLGKPGASPKDYADVVSKMIPAVRPEILLVAVLQGDDLAQLRKQTDQNSAADTGRGVVSYLGLLRAAASRLLRRVMPNTMEYRWSKLHTQATSLGYVWRKQSSEAIERWNSDQRERFNGCDATIRRMFMDGDLNPSLVHIAVTDPRYFLDTWDLNSHHTAALVDSMAEYLSRINNVCVDNKVTPLVTIVPNGAYVSSKDYDSTARLGFSLDPEMLTSGNADRAVQMAAAIARVECYSVLSEFRLEAARVPLYFVFDGHFNAEGHHLYARLVAKKVEELIQSRKGKRGNEQYDSIRCSWLHLRFCLGPWWRSSFSGATYLRHCKREDCGHDRHFSSRP